MEKVAVIGCSAAGKSTVSRQLGEILGVEVIHLDKELWQPGCQLTPPEQEPAVIDKLLSRHRWVMDGNYTATLARRLSHADTVVLIDYPRWLCLLRAMKRMLKHFGRTRPDMGSGCPETFNPSFLKWIWRYPHDERPELIRHIRLHAQHAQIVILRSDRQVRKWLEQVRRQNAAQLNALQGALQS